MASYEMIVKRRAIVNQRIQIATGILAERFAIDVAPPFPNTPDTDHRANNEMERIAINLERLVEATEGNGNGEAKADGKVSDGQRSERRNRRGDA